MIPRTKEQYKLKCHWRRAYLNPRRGMVDRPRRLTHEQKYGMRLIRSQSPGFVEWYQRIYQCGVTFRNTIGSCNQ